MPSSWTAPARTYWMSARASAASTTSPASSAALNSSSSSCSRLTRSSQRLASGSAGSSTTGAPNRLWKAATSCRQLGSASGAVALRGPTCIASLAAARRSVASACCRRLIMVGQDGALLLRIPFFLPSGDQASCFERGVSPNAPHHTPTKLILSPTSERAAPLLTSRRQRAAPTAWPRAELESPRAPQGAAAAPWGPGQAAARQHAASPARCPHRAPPAPAPAPAPGMRRARGGGAACGGRFRLETLQAS
eukprot:scaffold20615_cov63-Phaeocystis_antarctica.AAC.2